MMHLLFFVDGIRNIAAILIAELILVLPFAERRDRFRSHLTAGFLGGMVLSAAYILLLVYAQAYIRDISGFWYFLVALYCGAVIGFCFQIRLISLIWIMNVAYALAHLAYIIVYEFLFRDAFQMGLQYYASCILYALVCAILYSGFYLLFRKNGKYPFVGIDPRHQSITVFFAGVYVVFFVATILNQQNVLVSEEYYYLSAISDLVNCLFALFALLTILYVSRIHSEQIVSKALLAAQKTQYEMFQNSVDYINIKCHDLKKEIEHLRRHGLTESERLDAVASELAIYDAFAKTGSENLDIILTEKNLACIAAKIPFSYMAEASRLEAMELGDLYTLFSNALDNAIEYEKTVADAHKRFIRLYIRPVGQMVHVHLENYFEGELQLRDGLPVTTKADKTAHGFGTLSIRNTVKKYGGEMVIRVDQGIFSLDFGLVL